MDSHSSEHEPATPIEAHEASPALARPEPRLGILHLLVLTACVAVYMGIARAVSLAMRDRTLLESADAFQLTAGMFHGIGAGAALAGLLLVVVRRRRGLLCPKRPGEYLLVWMGFGVVARLAVILPLALASVSFGTASVYEVYRMFALLALFSVQAILWVWILIRLKAWPWRLFFMAIPVAYIASAFLMVVGAYSGMGRTAILLNVVPQSLLILVLLTVVARDHFSGERYSWTHWYGVATRLWIDAGTIATGLWLAAR
jgi:hypothetical protein